MKPKPKILAIIPARGDSKGLARKNILPVAGRPLLAWTIAAALNAKCISRVILSSDDDEIITIAKQYDCDVSFKRPVELATDTAGMMEVVHHALNTLPGYDYVILLQPTSPLRTAADIDAAFAGMLDASAPACVSVCPVEETPYWMYQLDKNNKLKAILELPENIQRRQDLPAVYSLNGAIYIARTDWLKVSNNFISPETIAYVMPKERSLDIDTLDDFELFQKIVTKISTAS